MASYKAQQRRTPHNIRRVEPLFYGVTFETLCGDGDAFTSDTPVNLLSLVKWEKLKKFMRQIAVSDR